MQYSHLILLALTACVTGLEDLYLDGDVIVEGLFEIWEPEVTDDLCPGRGASVRLESVMHAEAVKWYFNQLNSQADQRVKIGLRGHVTCGQSSTAAQRTVSILNNALTNNRNNAKPIIGVIGPELSSEASVVSNILSSVSDSEQLLQVGFSTTAASLTFESDMHPNFVRVVPNDDYQINVMVESMLQLEWNRIAIVHENNVYGNQGATKLEEKTEANGICTAMVKGIDVSNGIDFTQLTDAILAIQSDRVTGVVFFGSALTAQSLYNVLTIYSEVPIMMLSEGFNMNTRVFETSSGEPAAKAKGSLALSPFYKTVTEFDAYWRQTFMNSTILNTQITTNPWLLQVFYAVTGCTTKDCSVVDVTEQQINDFFSSQYMYVQYAILGAHVLAKLATIEHSRHCSNINGACLQFIASFRPGDMVTTAKSPLLLDIHSDFSWSPESLSTRGEFTLSNTGDIAFSGNLPIYQLYNYRAVNNGKFGLEKVGDLEGGTFKLDKSVLRDYKDGIAESFWPNVRKAQCPINYKCLSCINMDHLHEALIFDEGDAYIIGINPIFDSQGPQSCGEIMTTNTYQAIEAMRFAVTKINGDTNLFRSTKIGFIGISSCNNEAVVQKKIYDLFKNGVELSNGIRLNLYDKVIGFVGDVDSSISIAVAWSLKQLQYVQISYASTSPLLSDRTAYPYFLRVVTPDDEQAKAMIAVLQRLNATFIQLVYSEGAYGEGGKEKVHKAAYENDICIKQSIAVNVDKLNGVYDKLRLYPDAKFVIVFISQQVVTFAKEMVRQMVTPGEFIFFGSESWAKNPAVLAEDNSKQYMLGSLTVALEMDQSSELRTHILNLKPKPLAENPWFLLYSQEKRNCYFPNSFDKSKAESCDSTSALDSSGTFVLDTWATAAFVAATSLLKGADNHFKQRCGSSAVYLCEQFNRDKEGLIAFLKRVELDIEGTGDYMKVFDSYGNGNVGYRIYNIKQKEGDPQTLEYREVGRYPLEGTFTFETDQVYQRPGFTSVCPNTQACEGCIKTKTPPGGRGRSEKTSLNAGMVALGVLFGVAFIVVVVLALVIFFMRRQSVDDTYIHPSALDITYTDKGLQSIGPTSDRPHAIGQAALPAATPCAASKTANPSGTFHEIHSATEQSESSCQSTL